MPHFPAPLPEVSVRVCCWEPLVRFGGRKQVEAAAVLAGTLGFNSNGSECWFLSLRSVQSSSSDSIHGKDSFAGSCRPLHPPAVPDLWISSSNFFSSSNTANTFASVAWNT